MCVRASGYNGDPQLADGIDEICRTWATVTSGELGYSVPRSQIEDNSMVTIPSEFDEFQADNLIPQEIALVECPERGCLGYAFKLPGTFAPQPYAAVGDSLRVPFSMQDPDIWNVNLESIDSRCPVPTTNPGVRPRPLRSPRDPVVCKTKFIRAGKETFIPQVVCSDGSVINP